MRPCWSDLDLTLPCALCAAFATAVAAKISTGPETWTSNPTLGSLRAAGNIISVLVFISPIPTFWRIVRSKSTEDFEAAPYVLTLLNTLLWLYYGLTKPDGLLVATVNGFPSWRPSTSCSSSSTPPTKAKGYVKTAKLVAALDIGFFGVVFVATTFAIGGLDMKIMVIGLICACLSVFMYGSPLAAVRRVIASRSVEYMPFFLSFFLFLNGGVWATYAILDKDVFLGVPNGTGCFLGGIQLVIYAVYMNSKVASHSHSHGSDEAAYDASASLLSSKASRHGQDDVATRV
ncbi:Bidirectional sugar transporter SWEET17 [Triticum urartu]|uniref:Bidirectional sugar transporter SWEET n=1 Tax=Triticum urartu TaxID=4572 RepID=M7YG54_TRIUA|nr:Bidirectional sugar transporter SWEET17 [Triticum urartu]